MRKINELEIKVSDLIRLTTSLTDKLEKVKELRWCSKCNAPFKARYDTPETSQFWVIPYYDNPEITHCPACDEDVKKIEKAVEMAKQCPDKVLKLKGCEE